MRESEQVRPGLSKRTSEMKSPLWEEKAKKYFSLILLRASESLKELLYEGKNV